MQLAQDEYLREIDSRFEKFLADRFNVMPHIPGYLIDLEVSTSEDWANNTIVFTSELRYIPDPNYIPEQEI